MGCSWGPPVYGSGLTVVTREGPFESELPRVSETAPSALHSEVGGRVLKKQYIHFAWQSAGEVRGWTPGAGGGGVARTASGGEREPLQGEGVGILEGNLRAHRGEGMGWGVGFQEGCAPGDVLFSSSGKTVGTPGCHKRHKSRWAPQSPGNRASGSQA